MLRNARRILIVTAVAAEYHAVAKVFTDNKKYNIILTGIGPIAAAAETATALTSSKYDLVINAGIAGGFTDQTEVGSLVIADEIISADLGVQTATGFRFLDHLDIGCNRIQVDTHLVARAASALHKSELSVVTGPMLTVSTVTGTITTANDLSKRIPGAIAEAMEGFGVATAAQLHLVPILEIRVISNIVGPRERNKWSIDESLNTLTKACSVLIQEEIL